MPRTKKIKTMSINEYLFDDLLIEIFNNLTLKDQITCKIVCQRWLALLMTDYHFKHLRCLQLVSKVFTLEEISTILQSKYRFTSIVMDEQSYKVVPFHRMEHIWNFLGESVIDIKIKGLTDLDIYRLLKSFPLLKSLEMYGFNFTWVQDDIVPVFPHVEHLKVSNFFLVNDVQSLFGKLPKLKTVDYDIFNAGEADEGKPMVECFQKYPKFLKTLHWYDKSKEFDKIREDLLKLKNHNIDRLYYITDTDFKFLSKILEAQPRISQINVRSNAIPDLTRITSLDLSINSDSQFSLKPLAALTNLKKLYYKTVALCPIGHESFENDSVTDMQITMTGCECLKCIVVLLESFKGVENFHFIQKETSIPRDRLVYFMDHWPNLKKLIFNNRRCSEEIPGFELFPYSDENFPGMKYLSISEDIELYDNIHQRIPNLISLHFYINSESKSLDVITESVLPYLPELQHVLINFDETSAYHMTEEQNRKGFENVIKYSRKVEDLQLPILHGCLDMVHEATQLFKALPALMHIWFDQIRDGRIFVHRVYSRLDFLNDIQ
uniref:CSON014775 protein n=1 Tax=Culicoides sonorensis TaxID=179676 RepID=A0A336LN24_CULSO